MGSDYANWGDRRKNELAQHLNQYGVVWANRELVEICARLRSEMKSLGKELAVADAWVAADRTHVAMPLDFE